MKSRARIDGGQLLGRPGRIAYARQRFVPIGTVQLCFHVRERRPDDVVVVDVGPDHPGGFPPHAVNEVEISGRERRQVRPEIVGVGPPAAVMDDEADVERLRLLDALPRLAEQARLVGRRQRRGLADVDRGRAQADHGRCQAVGHGGGRHDEQADRPSVAFDQRDYAREQVAFGRQRRRIVGAGGVGVDAVQAHGHHHDLAVGAALQRRRDVLERMGMPHRDQDVARPGVRLFDRDGRRAEQLEPFRLAEAFVLCQPRSAGEQEGEAEHERGGRDPRALAPPQHERGHAGHRQGHDRRARRAAPLHGGAGRSRRREAVHARPAQLRDGQGAQGHGRGDGGGIGACQPRDPAGAGQDQQHARRGHGVEALGQRAQARMRQRQRLGQHAGRGQPAQQLPRINHGALDGRNEEEQRGDAQSGVQDTPDPARRGEMADQASQRDLGPERPAVGRDEDEERDREQDRPGGHERRDDMGRTPQDAEARRRELVRQPRQGIAAADGRKRQAERQQRDRDARRDRLRVRRPPQRQRGGRPIAAGAPQ